MPHDILHDWSFYDRQKLRRRQDLHTFLPEEPWEIDFLTDKIMAVYPVYSQSVIHTAITAASHRLRPPFERAVFVAAVIDLIRELPN